MNPAAEALSPYRCLACEIDIPPQELRRIPTSAGDLVACPRCGRSVQPADPTMRAARSFGTLLELATQLAPSGAYFRMTCLTGVFVALLSFAQSVVAGGLAVAWFFAVIVKCAGGDHATPPLPTDWEDKWDLAGWILRFYLTLLVAFGPALAAVTLAPDAPALAVVLALLGLLHLPGGLIIASFRPWYYALNPLPAWQVGARIGRDYLYAALALIVAVAMDGLLYLGGSAAADALPVPILPTLLLGALMAFPPLVACRLLGLLVHEHRELLGLG